MLNYASREEDYLYSVGGTPTTTTTRDALIIPIESRRERHQQKQAEEGAFGTQDDHILMSLFFCETCQVGIGPDHVEQELWLYHATCVTIAIGEIPTYFEDAYLRICGGCAKRYRLPEKDCLVHPEYWLTTILIEPDERRIRIANIHDETEWYAIRRAIDQVVKAGVASIMKHTKNTNTRNIHTTPPKRSTGKKRENHDNLLQQLQAIGCRR